MTLILAQVSRYFALQVSDRLVTTRDGTSFDRVSNKNILFFAPDGLVSLGYTGPAYIHGVTTDQWLAEILVGEEWERDDQHRPMLRLGRTPNVMHIGPALQLLRDRLQVAFATLGKDAHLMMFEVLVVGWQQGRRKPLRPIVAGIQKPAGQAEFNIWRSHRHFGRDFVVVGTSGKNLLPSEVDVMRSGLRAVGSADEAENVLVNTIRTVSNRMTYVGPDCMSILIPPPSLGWARIRYVSASPAALGICSRSNGSILATAPAAFSPWVIGPGLVHAPSILSGSHCLSLGEFEVRIEAPEPQGTGLKGAIGAIERPSEPR